MIKPQLSSMMTSSSCAMTFFQVGRRPAFFRLYSMASSETVDASPAEGAPKLLLATVASQLGKRATIFVAQRKQPHPRTLMAKRLGAKIVRVSPGYLNVVQARAREYCQETRCALWRRLASMCREPCKLLLRPHSPSGKSPTNLWCAGRSGVLARGLAQPWPNAGRHVVQVGRALSPKEVAGGRIHKYPKPFKRATRNCRHFQATPITMRRPGNTV